MVVALIVFAGKGTRMSSNKPKQFIKIDKKDLVAYTIDKFELHPLIDEIVLATSEEFIPYVQTLVFDNGFKKVVKITKGGESRQETIRLALNQMDYPKETKLLIHDGDRPLVKGTLITEIIRALDKDIAISPMIKSSDALEGVSNSGRKIMIDDISYDIQTPQGFRFIDILEAHNRLKDVEVVDDVSLLEKCGEEIKYIPGDKYNYKITRDIDLDVFKELIKEDGQI